MQSYIDFFIDRFGSFISWAGSMQIVGGVSLLSFCLGLFVIGVLINSYLLRGK